MRRQHVVRTKVGIAAAAALVFAGGGAVFAASTWGHPNPTHAGVPGPRTFPHHTVPIPTSEQPVPTGLTTAVGKSQAIRDALHQIAPRYPHGSPTVASAALVSKATAEADMGSVSPWFPAYFWKVGFASSTDASAHVFVFVGAQTGHPWIIWTPPSTTR